MTALVSVDCRTGTVNRWMEKRHGGRIVCTHKAQADRGAGLDPAMIHDFLTAPESFEGQQANAPVAA